MRKMLVLAVFGALLIAAYIASIVTSFQGLANAAKSGDAAEIIARTDMPRLRRSITDQILDAYLEKGTDKKPHNRMIANTYGASVADAMLAKFLTTENLTQLLRTGSASDPFQGTNWDIPPLGAFDTSRILDLVGRVRPIQIKEIEFRISDTDTPETYSSISLHLHGTTWQLSGIRLPRPLIDKLSKALPRR